MDKIEIQNKITELKEILLQYQNQLNQYEKDLFEVISQYQKVVEEEKIKEIRKKLVNYE
ncbi:MAG: hypothetical protein HY773_02940 [Candidatus Terrybacteria bacterium]|nr:hypothetical protein [Candidatus Terrybacteria bacterium]